MVDRIQCLRILSTRIPSTITIGPHAHDYVERASRALNAMEAISGSSWGFTTEILVATYKPIVRPILNYTGQIWFNQASSSHLDKLEVIQNKALRIATGCHQKAAASHLRAETGVLPQRAHLELCNQQFYASALHPSHQIVTFPHPPNPEPRPLRATLQASYPFTLTGLRVRGDDPNAPTLTFGGVLEEGAYPLARRLLRGRMI